MEDDWYIGQPAPDDLVRTKIAQAAAAAYKYDAGIEGRSPLKQGFLAPFIQSRKASHLATTG
jgi:hypothetical protein